MVGVLRSGGQRKPGIPEEGGSRQTLGDPDAALYLGPKSGQPVILELLSAPRTLMETVERPPAGEEGWTPPELAWPLGSGLWDRLAWPASAI